MIEMFKTSKKSLINALIFPVFLIWGLIRQNQIQTNEASMHRPTMTGIFTLYSYIFIGVSLTIMTFIVMFFYRSNLLKNKKIKRISLVLIIGLPLVCLLLLMFP